MNRLYVLAAAALLTSPAVAFAQDCIDITAVPAVISAPGKYCLAGDFTINSTSARAVTINSSDVTLDCRGHTLKNAATSNAGSSIGISLASRNNVVIEHCRVIGGFQIGIDASQVQTVPSKNYYIQIRDNYIAGPFWHGIRAFGSAIEVTGNKVYDIGGQLNQYAIGIRVGGSTLPGGFKMHVVRDNSVIGTNSPYSAAYGIFSDGSVGSVFLDNGIAGTAPAPGRIAYGLYILGQHNRISDNHITGINSPDEGAIWTTDGTTSCFDNYLRTVNWTQGCDSTYGNY